MKSRPMIFSAPMVRAILADQKTQTRRVVKLQPPESTVGCVQVWKGENHWDFWGFNGAEIKRIKCPYGVVGDRLWVREGYRQELNLGHDKNGNWPDAKSLYSYFYKADCDNPKGWGIGVWKSPMFMPRTASRIELEITGIRVERVQDISNADIRADGACGRESVAHRVDYEILWDSINGKKHPWESNPWVWVVEFKRVEVQS